MIRFFNTGYFSRYIIIIVLAIIIWLPSFLFPNSFSGATGIAYFHLSNLLNSPLLLTILSAFITVVTSIVLNQFAIRTGIISKVSTFAMILFVLLSSIFVVDFHNNPFIWVNFIMIFVWANIMQLPYTNNAVPVIFNASFLVGIASLFYSPLVLLFILIWMSIFIHRIVTWRNLIVTIIGVGLPYFFLFSFYYATNIPFEDSKIYSDILNTNITLVIPTNIIDIISAILFVPMVSVSIVGIISKLNDKSINLRRNLLITIVYFFLGLIIYLLYANTLSTLLIITVPAVLILSSWFSNVRKQKWYNIAMVLSLLVIVVNQYAQLFINIFI